MLHIMEDVWLLDTEGVRTGSTTTRIAIPGGWLYTGGQVAQFVPDPAALHVRDTRRLKLREGCQLVKDVPDTDHVVWSRIAKGIDVVGWGAVVSNLRIGTFTAYHADRSETDHATRLEAHDALIASGSESPFEAVTGPAVKS
jgi:hypothetical protein